MTDTAAALEEKLKSIIDTETEKDPQEMNCRLIGICTDGILRLYNTESLIIPGEKYENFVNEIVNGKKIKLSKTAKIILIAAAIIALLAATAIGYGQIQYNLFNFDDHASVSTGKVHNIIDKPIESTFIPDGFELISDKTDKYTSSKVYSDGTRSLQFSKLSFFEIIDFDNELGEARETVINGQNYVIYGNDTEFCGINWFSDKYFYNVAGNLPEAVLLEIALATE